MEGHSPARQEQQHGATETAESVHEQHSAEHPTLAVYYATFGALMVLLVVTLLAAMVDLGTLNVVIAMGIAAAKIALIMVFFMHLKYSSVLSRVFAGTGLVWLVILFVMTFMDFATRPWLHR
jgi:cytochrome c oxidase subunit IV